MAGQSLDPVDGDVYVVSEKNDGPDTVILFKGPFNDETTGNYPTDADGKVEFVNKVLADKGLETMTAEEIQFVRAG